MVETTTVAEMETATEVAEMIILVAGNVVIAVSDDVRACSCECACDESCYSCRDCDNNPECAC